MGEKMQKEEMTPEKENLFLKNALIEIRDKEGRVCAEFEICNHESCQSSYRAWEIADRTLRALGYKRKINGE